MSRGSRRRFVAALAVLAIAPAVAEAGQNILEWRDNSTNERTFYIARKLGPCSGTATWYFRASVGADVTRYTDTGLVIGQTYCYKVRAVNASGVSAYSNEAQGIAKPSPTCSLVKTIAPDGTVTYTAVCH